MRRAQGRRAGAGTVVVSAERGTWALAGDVLVLLERAACEAIPPFRDDKAADPLASRNAQARRPGAAQGGAARRGGSGSSLAGGDVMAWPLDFVHVPERANQWTSCSVHGRAAPCMAGMSAMAGRAQDADDYSKDYVERDERRLTELGRRAVEMFAAAHIFAGLQEAHSEAESIRRQDALIQEVRVLDGRSRLSAP